MASISESDKNYDTQPKTAITPMERARRNKRAGKFLLGALVAGGVLGAIVPNLAKAHEANKYGPAKVIKVPYTVGFDTSERLVSEIASDMHQVAPNQDQTEADSVIKSYLPPADQRDYHVYGGEKFVFQVDEASGKILPKPAARPSGQGG